MQSKRFCKISSKKIQQADYRFPVHKRFATVDDTFDARYCAVKHCKSIITETKVAAFQNFQPFDIESTIREVDQLSVINNKKILCKLVHSDYSQTDRQFMIDQLLEKLESNQKLLTACPTCFKCDSAYNFLSEVAEKVQNDRDKPSFRNTSNSLYFSDFDQTRQSPIQYIETILTKKSNCTILVIIIRKMESIKPEIFSDIILQLNELNFTSTLIIAFNESCHGIPTIIDKKAESLIGFSTENMVSPWVLIDTFSTRLFALRKLPVFFEGEILNWIQEGFCNLEPCLHTAINKIIRCLELHFIQRKSLLSMFMETHWLKQMYLLPKFKNSKREDHLMSRKGISALLELLDGNDLKGTGLSLARKIPNNNKKPKAKENQEIELNSTKELNLETQQNNSFTHKDELNRELNDAEATIMMVYNQSYVDYAWFICLKIVRDTVFKKEKISEFCSHLLWAGIIEKDETTEFLSEFFEQVKESLINCTFLSLQNMFIDMNDHLNSCLTHLNLQLHTTQNEENKNIHLSEKQNVLEKNRSEINNFLVELQGNIELLVGISSAIADIAEDGNLIFTMKQILETETTREVEVFQEPDNSVEVDTRRQLIGVLNQKQIFAEFIVDIGKFLLSSQENLLKIQKPPKLPGILHLETNVLIELKKISAGDIHGSVTHLLNESASTYFNETQNDCVEAEKESIFIHQKNAPRRFLPSSSSSTSNLSPDFKTMKSLKLTNFNPDSISVLNWVKSINGIATAKDGFEFFKSCCDHMETSNANTETEKSKKRKLPDPDKEEEVRLKEIEQKDFQLRCRFATALNDICRTGIIYCRQDAKARVSVVRQVFTWL